MIDSGHIWPSFFVAFSLKKHRHILRMLPFLVFFSYLAIGIQYGKFGIYRTHAYMAAIHFIRQQYGLYKLSCNINPRENRWLQKIEICALYLITITSLTARMSNGSRWMREGDLVRIPGHFYEPSLYIFVGSCIAVALIFGYQWYQSRMFSKSRFIIYSSAVVAWGTIGFTDYPLIALFPLFHDLPYLGLVYKYPIKAFSHFKSMFKNVPLLKVGGGFLLFLLITIVVGAHVEFAMYEYLDFKVDPALSQFTLVTFCALAFLPTTTHYLIDAVIWRKDVMPNLILDNAGK